MTAQDLILLGFALGTIAIVAMPVGMTICYFIYSWRHGITINDMGGYTAGFLALNGIWFLIFGSCWLDVIKTLFK